LYNEVHFTQIFIFAMVPPGMEHRRNPTATNIVQLLDKMLVIRVLYGTANAGLNIESFSVKGINI